MRNGSRIARLAVLAVAFSSLAACQAQAPAPAAPAAPDYAAEYAPMMDTMFEVWDARDYAMLDGLLAANYVRRAPDQNADSIDELKAFMQQVHATYPDFHIVMNQAAYGKDVAFAEWTVTGTFTAEGAEPAKVDVSGATMWRIAGGKLAEEHVYYDTKTLDAQTGTVTPPHAATK